MMAANTVFGFYIDSIYEDSLELSLELDKIKLSPSSSSLEKIKEEIKINNNQKQDNE